MLQIIFMNEWNKIFCIVSGEMNHSRSTEEVDILVHWNIFVIRRKYFCCVFGGRVGCTECGYVDVGVTEAGPSQLQLPLPCCRRRCTPHWSKLKKRIFGVWSMRHSLAPLHFNLRLTGCPTIEYSLSFGCFLGCPCSYRGLFYHFSTAQETTIPKLTLLASLCQKLIKLQSKTWGKLNLDII